VFSKKQKIIILVSFFAAVFGLLIWPRIVRLADPFNNTEISKNKTSKFKNIELVKPSDSLKQITVVMENIPPYSYTENDSVFGFDVELSKVIFEKMKIKPVYKTYTWSRCLELMKARQADAILTIFLTNEREEFLHFPDENCSYEPNAFFALIEAKNNFTGNLSEMSKLKIGVKSNTSYGFLFDHADYLKRDTSKDQETLILKIIEKRLEIGIGSIPVISYISKKMNFFEKIKFLKPYVTIDPMYIAFSKKDGNEELARNFSKELKEFKKSISYKYLLKKYDIISTVAK